MPVYVDTGVNFDTEMGFFFLPWTPSTTSSLLLQNLCLCKDLWLDCEHRVTDELEKCLYRIATVLSLRIVVVWCGVVSFRGK